jgi:hypothetical protein
LFIENFNIFFKRKYQNVLVLSFFCIIFVFEKIIKHIEIKLYVFLKLNYKNIKIIKQKIMNINEILENPAVKITVEEEKIVFDQMKEKNFFDLSATERLNLIEFICEKSDEELAVDYLFHVLDNEIPYPNDEDRLAVLFADDRMQKMKKLMIKKLQDDEADEISDDVTE